MYKHDDLVSGLTDFEKTSVTIPERPITYVAEPPSFEELILKIVDESPMQKLERALQECRENQLRSGTDDEIWSNLDA